MDKTKWLLDALNNPEKYSSAKIEKMLQDSEVKEIFDLLDKTKSSLQPISAPDIEEEWDNFKNKNLIIRKSKLLSFRIFFSGKIAVSIIVTILCITAVAAVVGISVISLRHKENISSEKKNTEVVEIVEQEEIEKKSSIKIPFIHPKPSFETVIFDNETLEVIMNHISDFYGYKVEFNNDFTKSLRLYFRWDKALSIQEIIESLNNFEQIHLIIEDKTIKID